MSLHELFSPPWYAWKLIVLNRNTWYHTTMYQLFVLDRNTWNYMTTCKLFVFDRNTWNHTVMSKLFVLDRNTWNHTTICKLFVLDRNTWNHTTMCKLFVLDRNTWYHITMNQLFVLRILTWSYNGSLRIIIIFFIIIFTLCEFFTEVITGGFSLKSKSQFPKGSRTLLSILADLNNDVVWMIVILLLIPSYSCLFSRPL